MVTNPFVNNWSQGEDQNLLDELTVESIQFWGMDVAYIPRTLVKEDDLYSEDTLSKFASYVTIEMYIADTQGFGGEGDLFTKFGLDIRDTVNFEVSRTRFTEAITAQFPTIVRPREGDLIFLPAPIKRLWEIKFVEHEQPFYQIGRLPKFKLQCEKFRYSHERLETGLPDADAIAGTHGYALELVLGIGTGEFTANELVYQGSYPAATTATGLVVSWAVDTKTLKVKNITGTFSDTRNVVGVSSGASYTLVTADSQNNANDRLQDNVYLENQHRDIIDFSESNPFSE